MSTIIRGTSVLLVSALVASMAVSQASAWNPPDGPAWDPEDRPGNRPDLAYQPPTPTTLLWRAHGYITQNGISILYNDGYWFAAQFLRDWQYELLNGVRYADVRNGKQKIYVTVLKIPVCRENKLVEYCKSWSAAANNHYFNSDTGRGLDLKKYIKEYGGWTKIPGVQIYGKPPLSLDATYGSALEVFSTVYCNALNSSANRPVVTGYPVKPEDIHGRQGIALAMFYLGWASHFMQDLTVVHHTFDEGEKNHQKYEDAADGFITTPPVADGQQSGIYYDELTDLTAGQKFNACVVGSRKITSRTYFPLYAAVVSHDQDVLDAIAQEDYSNVQYAIPLAQSFQAGLYAAFLTDIGLPPVHMSAVIGAL
jgi:hypothetical protein